MLQPEVISPSMSGTKESVRTVAQIITNAKRGGCDGVMAVDGKEGTEKLLGLETMVPDKDKRIVDADLERLKKGSMLKKRQASPHNIPQPASIIPPEASVGSRTRSKVALTTKDMLDAAARLPHGRITRPSQTSKKRKRKRNTPAPNMRTRPACPDYMSHDKWCHGRCNLYHPKGTEYEYHLTRIEMEKEETAMLMKMVKAGLEAD